MRFRSATFAAMAVALIGAGGCASAQPYDVSMFGEATADQGATLRVMNNNWSDMTIYAVRGGMRIRLGRVGGMSTGELRIPSGVMASSAPLRFLASPLASNRNFLSQVVAAVPGQRINLHLESNLNLSTFTVR